MLENDTSKVLLEIFLRVNNNSECSFPNKTKYGLQELWDPDEDTVNFLFRGVGTSVLVLFGIPANILSVFVLAHREMKSPTTTLLLGLTISDIVLLTAYFLCSNLHLLLNKMKLFPVYFTHIRPHIFPFTSPTVSTAQMSSIYFTVAITLERYIAVCHPLKARLLCTHSAAIKSFLLVVVISILYNVPTWFAIRTITVRNCDNQMLWYSLETTEWGRSLPYSFYYWFWGYTVVFFVIPFVILVYFNRVIYSTVKQQASRRSSIRSSRARVQETSENLQLSTMLLGIVVVYLASYSFLFVASVMKSCGLQIPIHLHAIAPFLFGLSHSSNFVFYCTFGTRFRRRLKKTLGIPVPPNSRSQSMKSISQFPGYIIKRSSKDIYTSSVRGSDGDNGMKSTLGINKRSSSEGDISSFRGSQVTVDTMI